MHHRHLMLAAAATLILAAPALAQTIKGKPIVSQSGTTPLQGVGFGGIGEAATPVTPATPLPTIGAQETFQLVKANAAAAAVTVAGGDYVLSQTCTGYGTLAFRVLGPDAATYLTLASYSATDTGSAHAFVLGSYAKVQVTITGTSGCNALLSRVPA